MSFVEDTYDLISAYEEGKDFRDSKTFNKAVANVDALCNIANGSGRDLITTATIMGLLDAHRYIQNETVIALITALGDLGRMYEETPEMVSDARNSFAMSLCLKIRKALQDDLFWRTE